MVAEGPVPGQVGVARQIDVGRLAVATFAVVVVALKRIERRIEVGRAALLGTHVARGGEGQAGENRPVGLDQRIARHVVRPAVHLAVDHHGIAVVLRVAAEVGAVAVVDGPKGVDAIARAVVIGAETAHEARLGLQRNVAGDLVVVGHVHRILLVVVVVLHALAVVVAQTHVVAVVLAAPLDADAVVLRHGGTEHMVGPPRAVGPRAALDLRDGGIVGAVRPDLARIGALGAAVFVGFVLQTRHQHGIAPIVELVAEDAYAHLGREPDVVLDPLARFGRHHDDAVGAARTVDRRGRGVLQHLDRLDDRRIDARQVAGVAHGHSVDDDQRRIRPVDRTDAAHTHRHAALRAVVRIVDHRKTRHAALQQLVDRAGRNLRDIRGPDRRDAAREVALAHRAVADHHHFVDQLGILFEPDVDGRAPRHRNLLRLVAEERDDERLVGRSRDPEGTGGIGGRTPQRALHYDRRTCDGSSVGTARHDSPDRRALRRQIGRAPQQGYQQHE